MTELWLDNLSAVLLTDRSTVRKSTGYTPFYFNYGADAVLSIELDIPTWKTLPWLEIQTIKKLLALRARQIQRKDEDLKKAALYLRRMREKGKKVFDADNRLRQDPVAVGEVVLLYDIKEDKNLSARLEYRWLGFYWIHEANNEKGTYLLAELDGAVLRGTFIDNRLKRYYTRVFLNEADEEKKEENRFNYKTTNFRRGDDVVTEVEQDDDGEEKYLTEKAQRYTEENQEYVPEGESFAVVM